MTDERDPLLDRLYREGPKDEPSPAADRRILAAAREAIAAEESVPEGMWPLHGRHSWLLRWRLPLAVAATVLVSATVTLMMYDAGLESPVTAPRRAEVEVVKPRGAEEPPPAARNGPVAEEATSEPVPPARRHERAAAAREETPQPAASGSVPAAPPAPPASPEPQAMAGPRVSLEKRTAAASKEAEAAPSAPDVLAGGASSRSDEAAPSTSRPAERGPVEELAPQRSTVSPASPPAAAPPPAQAKAAATIGPDEKPEAVIERIRSLHNAGRSDEARALLELFRTRFPDFALPSDLR